jgi:hypothetical protein
MFVIPALAALFGYLYWRPHQITEVFQFLTINRAMIVVALALVLDLGTRVSRLRWSPLVGVVFPLAAWCVLTVAIRAPEAIEAQFIRLAVAMIVFVAVSQGLQSLRAISAAGAVLLLFTLGMAFVGSHQGLAPMTCYKQQEAGSGEYDPQLEISDGRPCAMNSDCREGGLPNAEYVCEHDGLLGTHSIGGRVRYRGILEDPNEMSWTLSMGMPLAFAFYERRRSKKRLVLLAVTLVLAAMCMVMTQSRSGQLGMLATLGIYFVRRFKLRGLLLGAVLGAPLLLLGGRSGEAAESSSEERLECWAEAISMWRQHPFMGVGMGQFTEHHYLTAHNSFLLTLAELGPIGLFLWSSAIYLAVKITIQAQIHLSGRQEAAAAVSWSNALLASTCGLVVSAVFLSLAYHAVLWIFLGLVGALYGAIRAHDDTFRVRFGWRDAVLVFMFDTAFVVLIALYAKIKGAF